MTDVIDSDDVIEIIETRKRRTGGRSAEAELNACLLCELPLAGKSNEERKEHYAVHASRGELQTGSSSSSSIGSPPKSGVNNNFPSKQNVFWSRSMPLEPPSNFTPNLISLMKYALQKQLRTGNTTCAYLCHESAILVNTELWDSRWGCGYRNFLMACSALNDQNIQPSYSNALNKPSPPGLRNLQQWIEDAWKQERIVGFDKEGAGELDHKLLGTKKWIGTAELCVAFTYRGIPAKLVDFPEVSKDAENLLRWVEKYFTSRQFPSEAAQGLNAIKTTVGEALRNAGPIVVTERMPLVLQHDGHSRTIVGFEKSKNGKINLLIFDPGKRVRRDVRDVALAHYNILHGKQLTSSSSKKGKSVVTKMLQHVLHPGNDKRVDDTGSAEGSTSKRPSDTQSTMSKKLKRGKKRRLLEKVGMVPSTDTEDVIEISSDEDIAERNETDKFHETQDTKETARELARSLDPKALLQDLRVLPSALGKKNEYQILYFPMGPLLSQEERIARRVVTSEVIR